MKKNFLDIIYDITLHLVSILFIVNVLLLVCCILNFVLRLFGVEYGNLLSLMLFFLYSILLRLPLSLMSRMLVTMLLSARIFNLYQSRIVFSVLSISTSIIAMGIVDYFMVDIIATPNIVIAFAIASTLLSLKKIKVKQE